MSHGNWIKAIDDNAKLSQALDDALAECEGMDDDFRRIGEWAEIFHEPKRLSETVAKNWLLHRHGIKKDLKKE